MQLMDKPYRCGIIGCGFIGFVLLMGVAMIINEECNIFEKEFGGRRKKYQAQNTWMSFFGINDPNDCDFP